MYHFKKSIIALLSFMSCNSGKLNVLANIPDSLKETSAIEKVANSNLLWTIEDSGNKNNIYGLDLKGKIVKDIDINNAKNVDWEDLTSDASGNLYIGDFGNNNGKRKLFTIYKVSDLNLNETKAKRIDFELPKGNKSEDFEAFFIYNNVFYLFSKHDKHTNLYKVPNVGGKHKAEFVTKFKLKGKNTKITAADISANGKVVVLLNHDKLLKLTNFSADAFFDGTLEHQDFEHDSQKEGVCFKDSNTVFITDERTKGKGCNLYTFKL